MSRKTKLSFEAQQRIAGYVNAGAPLPSASVAAGIPWSTCRQWMRRGREGVEPYSNFVAAIQEAKARWEIGSAMRVVKASDNDWKAAAWLLERRRPKTWGPPRQKIDNTVNVQQRVAQLTAPEMRDAVADAVAADAELVAVLLPRLLEHDGTRTLITNALASFEVPSLAAEYEDAEED